MEEIGEVVEVAVGERAPHFHRRKIRAKPLAIAAGIADRHQAVGPLQNLRSVQLSCFLPASGAGYFVSPCFEPFWIRAATSACSCPSSHVRIDLDAGLRQVDDIDAAGGRLDGVRKGNAVGADFRPARILLDVVAIDDQRRNVFPGIDLGGITEGPARSQSTP